MSNLRESRVFFKAARQCLHHENVAQFAVIVGRKSDVAVIFGLPLEA